MRTSQTKSTALKLLIQIIRPRTLYSNSLSHISRLKLLTISPRLTVLRPQMQIKVRKLWHSKGNWVLLKKLLTVFYLLLLKKTRVNQKKNQRSLEILSKQSPISRQPRFTLPFTVVRNLAKHFSSLISRVWQCQKFWTKVLIFQVNLWHRLVKIFILCPKILRNGLATQTLKGRSYKLSRHQLSLQDFIRAWSTVKTRMPLCVEVKLEAKTRAKLSALMYKATVGLRLLLWT